MKHIDYPRGATPLAMEELELLIPQHINNRKDLDEWEANNIVKAMEWLYVKYHKKFLSIDFIKRLHKKCLMIHGNGQENFAKPKKI